MYCENRGGERLPLVGIIDTNRLLHITVKIKTVLYTSLYANVDFSFSFLSFRNGALVSIDFI